MASYITLVKTASGDLISPSAFVCRVADAAKKRGIPVKELADLVGVSRMTMYSWRRGDMDPSPRMLDKLEELEASWSDQKTDLRG